MTRLEILAGYLDQEPGEMEKKNQQQYFLDKLEFWSLCIDAKYLLLEQERRDDKDRPEGNGEVAT